MALFAFTLSPALRGDLLSIVQTLFIAFVLISFVCVAGYTAMCIRTGRLFVPGDMPLPIVMNRATAWLFVISVLGLIVLQPALYIVVVMVGIAGALVESGRTASTQFGLHRLKFVRATSIGMVIFGAVMLVEAPLTDGTLQILDRLNVAHPEQQSVQTFREFTDASSIFQFLVLAVFVLPMIEELFFRGFLLTFFKNYMSTWVAIILSGGIFALAHQNIGAAIPLWFLGVVLGTVYEHTGSLLVPMTIHGCFNLATGLNLLLDKGNSS